jgi:D-inositol-3-phosphate glycosyltransferase
MIQGKKTEYPSRELCFMQRNRKVIIIGSAYPIRGGGISTFNERLAKAFIDWGDEVIIHTFKLLYPFFLFPGKTQRSEDTPPEQLNIAVTINSINPLNWIIVGRRIRNEKPTLVVIRYWIPYLAPCFSTIARIVQKDKQSKVIAITDNILPHEKMPGTNLLTSLFIRSVQGFIVMSKSVLQDLNRFDQAKPRRYCPHPLYDNYGEIIPKEEAKRKIGLDTTTKYLLFFGFIREYKGLDILIRAFSDTRLRSLPIKLLIAGEFYTDSKLYTDLITELDLNEQVVLKIGFVPNDEVHLYFCAADLVVQPYRAATQSGVTQIAYHFNKPMITTDVGGLSEIVPNGIVGYVVEPDPKDIADAIFRFFSENREKEFSENAKKEKKKYSWEQLLNKIDELIIEIQG